MKNIILLSLLFIITFSNIQSQWNFVNPLPFTYGIDCSFFISDSIGWVAGQDGIVNKTTDGGKTWKRQITNIPESHTLTSIYFVNKDTGWTVGLVGHILKTTDGGEHWIPEISGTQEWFSSVSFVSDLTGYITGQNGIGLKTTDGGTHWSLLPSTHADIYASHFFTENTGFAVGLTPSTPYMLPSVFKTTNGGLTWIIHVVDSVLTYELNSCSFIDTLKGWAVGYYGLAYKTMDGGLTWEKGIPDSLASNYYTCVTFKDSLNGCISSANDSLILITTDGGKNWAKESLHSVYTIYSLFYTENILYASGSGGAILYSTDLGLSWNSLNRFVTHSNLQGATFADKNNVLVVGNDGIILKSSDTGDSWKIKESNTNKTLYSVLFTDSLNGLICGSGSTILKTTDGGNKWDKILIDSSGVYFNALFFINKAEGFCGGYYSGYDFRQHSIIFKTTDCGLTWNYLSQLPNEYNQIYMYFKDSLTGWAGGSNLYKTTDGGKSWSLQVTSGAIRKIQFLDSLHGLMISYGEIYKTTDGGISWKGTLVRSYVGYSCWFISVNEGWMCGVYGSLYHTSDAGQSWILQSYSTPDLNDIVFNGNTGLAFGNYGTILKTSNGGVSFINDNFNSVQRSEYYLFQNYPNPFNPITTISYSISKSSHVTIKVYDILGREVAVLLNEVKSPGLYKVNFNGSRLASGIYFYTLQANEYIVTKKLILLK